MDVFNSPPSELVDEARRLLAETDRVPLAYQVLTALSPSNLKQHQNLVALYYTLFSKRDRKGEFHFDDHALELMNAMNEHSAFMRECYTYIVEFFTHSFEHMLKKNNMPTHMAYSIMVAEPQLIKVKEARQACDTFKKQFIAACFAEHKDPTHLASLFTLYLAALKHCEESLHRYFSFRVQINDTNDVTAQPKFMDFLYHRYTERYKNQGGVTVP